MDGFQAATAVTEQVTPRRSPPRGAAKRAAWGKAMQRFERSLEAVRTAMDAHAAVEREMFAARQALEELPYPPCLVVVTDVEVYIRSGDAPALHRNSSQEAQIVTEGQIGDCAGEDEGLYASMVAALRAHRREHGRLAGICMAADAIADAKYGQSSAAIDRSDTQLLRLLRTPAPSFKELCWKVETLRRAECSEDVERDGWTYVLAELACFEGRTDAAPAQTKPRRSADAAGQPA